MKQEQAGSKHSSLSYCSTLKMEAICSSGTSEYFHGVISWKIELFIITVWRNSNPMYES
jgi:hypothetical protein